MIKTKVSINGMALYDFMIKNNLAQKDLAVKLGISESYLSQLLCGTRQPSPRLRRTMLEALAPLGFDDLFAVDAACSGGRGNELPAERAADGLAAGS